MSTRITVLLFTDYQTTVSARTAMTTGYENKIWSYNGMWTSMSTFGTGVLGAALYTSDRSGTRVPHRVQIARSRSEFIQHSFTVENDGKYL